jgi:hypothetical protein
MELGRRPEVSDHLVLSGTGGVTSPDWIIMGYRVDGEHWVIASRSLMLATLEARRDPPPLSYSWDMETRMPMPVTYRVDTTMTQLQFVKGTSYQDALRKLMASWSPDESEEQPAGALPSAVMALPAAEEA